jgi:hypothetical protein
MIADEPELRDAIQIGKPLHGARNMDPFEHSAVVAHFLAGYRVEIYAVDGTPPPDPDDASAEFYRLRSLFAVARQLRRGNPSLRVYAPRI